MKEKIAEILHKALQESIPYGTGKTTAPIPYEKMSLAVTTMMLEFVEWLKDWVEQVLDEESEMKWQVTIEAHTYELMTSEEVFKYWVDNIYKK